MPPGCEARVYTGKQHLPLLIKYIRVHHRRLAIPIGLVSENQIPLRGSCKLTSSAYGDRFVVSSLTVGVRDENTPRVNCLAGETITGNELEPLTNAPKWHRKQEAASIDLRQRALLRRASVASTLRQLPVKPQPAVVQFSS